MPMFELKDTIAAQATAPGEGGVAIVRVSGEMCEAILSRVFVPKNQRPLENRRLTFGYVVDGEEIGDEAMAVLMRAPLSYTREDVAEIQCHGSDALVRKILYLLIRAGARMARPGEFTCRAFLNGRIDLAQAEAVMRMIRAGSERAMRSAIRQMEGGVSAFVRHARGEITDLMAEIAAAIDFPDEVEETTAAQEVHRRCGEIVRRLRASCNTRAGRIEDEGLRVVLCGRPNAGKSSLMNALLEEERAIVTPIPGTTRDMVQGDLILGGSVIHLTDTAGLHATDDPVEQLGVARARRAMEDADLVLAVFDMSRSLDEDDRTLLAELQGRNVLLVLNKADLSPVLTAAEVTALLDAPVLTVSAADEASLAPLKARLAEQAAVSDNLALTQPRHVEAARRAARHLRQAAETARALSVDMASIDLQAAQLTLAEITGDEVEERLLDRVFGMFCVGK